MHDEGELLGGRYRLRRRIGTGPYGTVWDVADEQEHGRAFTGKEFDHLPRMHPTQYAFRLEQTETEAAEAARKLAGHPRLAVPVRVVIDGPPDDGGIPWLLSEPVAGTPLAEHLDAYGPLSPERAGQLAEDLIDAYEAHAAIGRAHRNVKPANVILTADGRAVLADFAPAFYPPAAAPFSSEPDRLPPLAHLAPERLRGHLDAPVSDLFAIGAVLYHCLEGETPYDRESTTESLRALVAEAAPRWPERARGLTPLLLGLLAPNFIVRVHSGRARELLEHARAAEGAAGPQDAVPRDKAPGPAPEDAVPPLPPSLLHTLSLPANGIEAFAFTPDGTFVIAAAAPAEVRCWDLGDQNPRPMRIDHLLASPGIRPLLRPRAGNAHALAFGAEGRLVATAGPDGRVRAWRPPSPGQVERAMELDELDTPLAALALDPAAVYLAVADRNTLRLWEPASGAQSVATTPLRRVTALAFSPDGTRLAAAGSAARNGLICLLDAWNGDVLATPVETGPAGATALAYNPDGTLLAAAIPGSGISLYDTTDWSPHAALPPGVAAPATARIAALAFTADARLLAVIPAGREVRVLSWRVPARTAARG